MHTLRWDKHEFITYGLEVRRTFVLSYDIESRKSFTCATL